MPLKPGSSRKVISENISELTHNGSRPRTHDQVVAIALHNADKYQHRAGGGGLGSVPFFERSEARSLNDPPHLGGLFHSDVAGRTDRLPHRVPADSFVFPADSVASLGQGNTLSGAKILDSVLGTAPYGATMPKAKGLTFPHARAPGGGAPADEPGVSHVMVAGGEYLATPDKLAAVGRKRRAAGMSRARTDLAAGHEWARELVDKTRKQQKKFLASAPKPKR